MTLAIAARHYLPHGTTPRVGSTRLNDLVTELTREMACRRSQVSTWAAAWAS